MKQTAVEFIEEYLRFKGLIITDKNVPQILIGIINQAKEMEKQQIIDAMDVCQRTDFYVNYSDAEQYYNETFKNK
jgi:hypothetical protein